MEICEFFSFVFFRWEDTKLICHEANINQLIFYTTNIHSPPCSFWSVGAGLFLIQFFFFDIKQKKKNWNFIPTSISWLSFTFFKNFFVNLIIYSWKEGVRWQQQQRGMERPIFFLLLHPDFVCILLLHSLLGLLFRFSWYLWWMVMITPSFLPSSLQDYHPRKVVLWRLVVTRHQVCLRSKKNMSSKINAIINRRGISSRPMYAWRIFNEWLFQRVIIYFLRLRISGDPITFHFGIKTKYLFITSSNLVYDYKKGKECQGQSTKWPAACQSTFGMPFLIV